MDAITIIQDLNNCSPRDTLEENVMSEEDTRCGRGYRPLKDSFQDTYSTDDRPVNEYESKIDVSNPKDIIVLADKRESNKMFLLSKNWIGFAKGYAFVPKMSCLDGKKFSSDVYYKKLVLESVPVGTPTITMVDRAIVNSRVKTRSPIGRNKVKTNRKIVSRVLALTWKITEIKVLLKDFSNTEYNDAYDWIDSVEAIQSLDEVKTLPPPEDIVLCKRRKVTNPRILPGEEFGIKNQETVIIHAVSDIESVNESAESTSNDGSQIDIQSHHTDTPLLQTSTPTSTNYSGSVSNDSIVSHVNDDGIYGESSSHYWSRASAAKCSQQEVLLQILQIVKDQSDAMKKQSEAIAVFGNALVDIVDCLKASRMNKTHVPSVDGPVAGDEESGDGNTFGSSSDYVSYDTTCALFQELGLPTYTQSAFLKFDRTIKPDSNIFDPTIRKKFIEALSKFNPNFETGKKPFYSLLRFIYSRRPFQAEPSEDKENSEGVADEDSRTGGDDADHLYIDICIKTEIFNLIVGATCKWPLIFMPSVRGNNVKKTDVEKINRVWKNKNHRQKVRTLVQSYLKMERHRSYKSSPQSKTDVTTDPGEVDDSMEDDHELNKALKKFKALMERNSNVVLI